MPRASSLDRRERLLGALASSLSGAGIEYHTGVDTITVRRRLQRSERSESLAPRHVPGQAPLIGPDQYDALRAQIAALPDTKLADYCAHREADQGQPSALRPCVDWS